MMTTEGEGCIGPSVVVSKIPNCFAIPISLIPRISASKNVLKIVKIMNSQSLYYDNWMLTYVCSDESETLFTAFSQETTQSSCPHKHTPMISSNHVTVTL